MNAELIQLEITQYRSQLIDHKLYGRICTPEQLESFVYYLERHIEVDGGHHSHLAMQMTKELMEGSIEKELEALQFVSKSLKARIDFWNAIEKQIEVRAIPV